MERRADWLDQYHLGGAAMNKRISIRLQCSSLILFALLLSSCLHNAVSSSGVGGNIGVNMWVSSNCVQPGDTVHLRATATNLGKRTWIVDLKDQPVFDIVLEYDTVVGRRKIRWSDGKLLSDLTRLELEPGESKTIQMDWIPDQSADGQGVLAFASYIFSSTSYGGVTPTVLINVGSCPGMFGP